jgi:hypothetical protein
VIGRRNEAKDEAGGTKIKSGKDKKGSPTHPQPQASSIPLFEQEGSAICDWFCELFSKRRVSPCQDSTKTTHPVLFSI